MLSVRSSFSLLCRSTLSVREWCDLLVILLASSEMNKSREERCKDK